MQYDENAEKYGYEGEMAPMKCDELKEVMNVMQVSGERIPSGYYKKSEVDEAIAELKEAWRSEHEACEALKAKLDKAIAERDGNQVCIDALKEKLVDANERVNKVHDTIARGIKAASKRERRLKRALWLARAERAEARKNYWYARSCHEGDDFLASIDGRPVKYIGCIKRANYDWLLTWSEVESKCRAKAEEYK